MDMSQTPEPGSGKVAGPWGPLPISHEEMIDGFGIVTVVEEFVPGVDKLLLDFDAGAPMPQVSLDTRLEEGSTAVMGDGRLMVVLRGTTGVATADVVMREIPPPVDPADLPSVEVIESFDPDEDEIEVLYDPQRDGSPRIEVRDFSDQTGAVVFFNEKPILAVRGAQGLSPDEVKLVPRQGPDN